METGFSTSFFEHELHQDAKVTLNCPWVKDPYVTTFQEETGSCALLHTKFSSGRELYTVVKLKPLNWMDIPKEELPPPDAILIGYTYASNGPIGYWAGKTLAQGQAKLLVIADKADKPSPRSYHRKK